MSRRAHAELSDDLAPDHPAFCALSPWLDDGVAALTLEKLNASAGQRDPPPATATGARIRFVASTTPLSARDYETRVLKGGEVPTRIGNLHDIFNALCWLAFPD